MIGKPLSSLVLAQSPAESKAREIGKLGPQDDEVRPSLSELALRIGRGESDGAGKTRLLKHRRD